MKDDGKGKDPKGGDYDIGYRRPPKANRFAKGQSGNPNGRPKGSASFSALIEKNLRKKILVRENGRERRAEAQEAIVATITNKAIKGDLHAARFLWERQLSPPLQAGTAPGQLREPVDSGDIEVIEAYYRRKYATPSTTSAAGAVPEPSATPGFDGVADLEGKCDPAGSPTPREPDAEAKPDPGPSASALRVKDE